MNLLVLPRLWLKLALCRLHWYYRTRGNVCQAHMTSLAQHFRELSA